MQLLRRFNPAAPGRDGSTMSMPLLSISSWKIVRMLLNWQGAYSFNRISIFEPGIFKRFSWIEEASISRIHYHWPLSPCSGPSFDVWCQDPWPQAPVPFPWLQSLDLTPGHETSCWHPRIGSRRPHPGCSKPAAGWMKPGYREG